LAVVFRLHFVCRPGADTSLTVIIHVHLAPILFIDVVTPAREDVASPLLVSSRNEFHGKRIIREGLGVIGKIENRGISHLKDYILRYYFFAGINGNPFGNEPIVRLIKITGSNVSALNHVLFRGNLLRILCSAIHGRRLYPEVFDRCLLIGEVIDCVITVKGPLLSNNLYVSFNFGAVCLGIIDNFITIENDIFIDNLDIALGNCL